MNDKMIELSILKQQVQEDFQIVSEHINKLYEVIGRQFEVIKALDARLDVLEAAKSDKPIRTEGVELRKRSC